MAIESPLSQPCVRCGYDVRGHPEDGRCPECGLSVEWSNRRRAPEFFGVAWLARCAGAVRLILTTQLLLLACWVISICNDFLHFTRVPFFALMLCAVVTAGSAAMWQMTDSTLFTQLDRFWEWV